MKVSGPLTTSPTTANKRWGTSASIIRLVEASDTARISSMPPTSVIESRMITGRRASGIARRMNTSTTTT